MAKEDVENLLIAGGKDEAVRDKYNTLEPKSEFVAEANREGFSFTVEELDAVLRESGDDFESYGNPRKRSIWWY